MEKVFELESKLFKIEATAPKDKMKLFLSVATKIPEETSVLYVLISEDESELERKSNIIRDSLQLPSITHTNTYDSANEILHEFEIDVIIFDSNEESDELFITSEVLIGGDESFVFANINFKEIEKKAYCHYVEKKGVNEKFVYEQIIECISGKIDIKNCHHDVIKDFAGELVCGEDVSDRRVLKGKSPVKGKDGKLLLLCKKYTGVPDVEINEVGTADFHSLRLFDNVRIGQKVARLYEPKPGKDGMDVLGNVINAEAGSEFVLDLCDNLTIEQSKEQPFKTISSKANGYITESNGSLKLNTEFFVDGDLDLRYGNIDFVGSILIKGDVLRGLKVRANEGIVIKGDVEEANLKSGNGSIIIEGYAYGGKRSLITAHKDFICKIAHELTVEAQNNIIIQKESIDSVFFCQSATLIDSGVLIGGKIFAAQGIQIFEAGNELENETCIYLANSVEATKAYNDVINSLEKHEMAINLIKAHLGPLAENPSKIRYLVGGMKKKMEVLLEKKIRVQESLDFLYEKKAFMLENAKFSEFQKVNFLKKIFPGVKIFCKEDEYSINEELSGPISFSYDEENEKIKEIDFEKIEIKE